MAVAALILSILGLVVAVLAALYSRTQAKAAKRTDARDAERRHEERTPGFEPEIEPLNEGTPWHRLSLRLAAGGKVDLTAVEVDILDGGDVEFTPSQNGVDPGATSPRVHASWSEVLRVGEQAVWQVQVPPGRPPQRPRQVRLRVTAAAGTETWVTVVSVPVPPDVTASIW